MAAKGKVLELISELVRRGVSPNQIKRETGYGQMVDGKWAAPAAVGLGAMGASDESEASFIGKMAKTFSQEAYKYAKRLEDSGASRDRIWKETGEKFGTPLYRGPEGKWRQEISDAGYRLDRAAIDRSEEGPVTRTGGDVFSHPELQKAYPEMLQDTRFSFDPYLDSRGSYIDDGAGGTISVREHAPKGELAAEQAARLKKLLEDKQQPGAVDEYMKEYGVSKEQAQSELNEDIIDIQQAIEKAKDSPGFSKDAESTALHEVTHAVQAREQFARGGSPQQFYEDLGARKRIALGEIAAINEEMSTVVKVMDKLKERNTPEAKQNLERMSDKYTDLMEKRDAFREAASIDVSEEAYRQYRLLTGEAEARNVQKRLPMSQQERIATPPWRTLDVPEGELINQFRVAAPITTGGLLGMAAMSPKQAQAAGIRPASTGTIEAAKAPWLSQAANYAEKVELPIIGRPFEGIAAWARGAAYQDPDKWKRAAIGALDIAP